MRLRVSEIVGPLRGTGREADALFSFMIVKRSSSRGLEAQLSTDTQKVRHFSTSGM